MATKDRRALIDANVLVYAANLDAPEHASALALRVRAERGDVDAVLAAQTLYEFMAVVTNASVMTKPLRPEDARREAARLAEIFTIIHPGPRNHTITLELLARTRITGRRIFDVALAATMIENGVAQIYTFDRGFWKIPGIKAMKPPQLKDV